MLCIPRNLFETLKILAHPSLMSEPEFMDFISVVRKSISDLPLKAVFKNKL